MSKIIDSLFDSNIKGLEKALDLNFRRNQALASNVANAETPLYRAVDLNFGRELESAFGKQTTTQAVTNARHLTTESNAQAWLAPDLSGATRADGNNVDLDLQMGRMAQTGGAYSMASTILKKQLSLIRQAIREAGR